jgi:hypothetical protein
MSQKYGGIHAAFSNSVELVPLVRAGGTDLADWMASERLVGMATPGSIRIFQNGQRLAEISPGAAAGHAFQGLVVPGVDKPVFENVVFFSPTSFAPYYATSRGPKVALWNEGSRLGGTKTAVRMGASFAQESVRRAVTSGPQVIGSGLMAVPFLGWGLDNVLTDVLEAQPDSPANQLLDAVCNAAADYTPGFIGGPVAYAAQVPGAIDEFVRRRYQSSASLRMTDRVAATPGLSIRAAPSWYNMPVSYWPRAIWTSGFGLR